VVKCGLMQGPESDEKMQPIQWTERPTGAFVGVGLMWPKESSLLESLFWPVHYNNICY
jgi:hypothetical protein